MFKKKPVDQKRLKKYIKKKGPKIFGYKKFRTIKVFNLPQGNWNFNFVAEINKEPFVFKIYYRQSTTCSFQNKGAKEYRALQSLKDTGIAPEPV